MDQRLADMNYNHVQTFDSISKDVVPTVLGYRIILGVYNRRICTSK